MSKYRSLSLSLSLAFCNHYLFLLLMFTLIIFIVAQEIVDAIEKCDNLRALRLEGNTLGTDAAKYIAKSLMKHPELEVRIVDINNVKS